MNSERNELTGPDPRSNVPAIRQTGEIAETSEGINQTELSQLPTPPMGIPLPPPPPSRPAPPSPLKAFWEIPGMKMLAGLVAALVLTIVGISIFDSSSSKTDGEWDPLQFAKTKDISEVLSSRPTEVVRRLYAAIGHHDASLACAYFNDTARQQFATDLGFPDCGKALLGLSQKVVGTSNGNDYANSIPSAITNLPSGDTIRLSSCDYNVKGGPSLGAFTLTKIERGLWLITGHENEPNPCPPRPGGVTSSPSPTGSQPTSSPQSPSSSTRRPTTSTGESSGYGINPTN